ncbi:PKD domain-containing protein [Methanorbis furvi]
MLLLVLGLVAVGVVSAAELTITGPTTAKVGEKVIFSVTQGDNVTYSWTIDGANGKNGASFEKTFDSAGKYTVKVTASGTNVSSEGSKEITIKPVASFTASKESGETPLNVTFTGSPASDVTYLWTFESGKTSDKANPTYSFTTAKKYYVSLVVTQNGITSDAYTKEITATEKTKIVPETKINEVSPKTGTAPLKVTFKATATNSDSVRWEFGDEKSATTAETTHTYEKPGTYTANFTATNTNGTSVKKSETITVKGNTSTYKVAIDATPVKGAVPLTVKFKLNTTIPETDISDVNWEFGVDSNSWISKNNATYKAPSWTYTEDGTYTVTLVVTANNEHYNAETKITVSDLVASFDASKTSGAAPLEVKFTDKSSGPTSWRWTIYKTDDGSRTVQKELISQNITYTFDREGKYEVELAAIKGSKSVTTYKTITVSAKATTAPTTVRTTAATTAPTTTVATTSPAVLAASLSADDELIPNPMDVIDEFIRLLLAMMNPEKYNLEI